MTLLIFPGESRHPTDGMTGRPRVTKYPVHLNRVFTETFKLTHVLKNILIYPFYVVN